MRDAGYSNSANFLNGLGGHDYGLTRAGFCTGTEWIEASEKEKLEEILEFISSLTTNTIFKAEHVSIAVPLAGYIPQDKNRMMAALQDVIDTIPEENLRNFRESIVSL
ncbi:MAG: hypothetical protein WCD42_08375 [Rhizomicrobium sp.]